MNGEPFCYNSRLTVRQLLELRSNGYDLTRILKDHPELRVVGIAAAYTYAAAHRERYGDFFEDDGSLAGPGLHRGGGGDPARAVPGPGRRHRTRRDPPADTRPTGAVRGLVVRSMDTPGDLHDRQHNPDPATGRRRPPPSRSRSIPSGGPPSSPSWMRCGPWLIPKSA